MGAQERKRCAKQKERKKQYIQGGRDVGFVLIDPTHHHHPIPSSNFNFQLSLLIPFTTQIHSLPPTFSPFLSHQLYVYFFLFFHLWYVYLNPQFAPSPTTDPNNHSFQYFITHVKLNNPRHNQASKQASTRLCTCVTEEALSSQGSIPSFQFALIP